MRSAVVVACSVLNVAIELMNHFPLFALLLRIKDPRRLPGTYFYLDRPVYPCPSGIKVNDYGTGSTYFRVVNKNGHPMLVLEVTFHFSGQGLKNLFNFQWHRYKQCHFGQFSSNTDCHIVTGASNGHFDGGV
jgi:hypothetical protein